MNRFAWHDWFAWRPVWINNEDVTAIVWLETVRRRRTLADNGRDFCWEYEITG